MVMLCMTPLLTVVVPIVLFVRTMLSDLSDRLAISCNVSVLKSEDVFRRHTEKSKGALRLKHFVILVYQMRLTATTLRHLPDYGT